MCRQRVPPLTVSCLVVSQSKCVRILSTQRCRLITCQLMAINLSVNSRLSTHEVSFTHLPAKLCQLTCMYVFKKQLCFASKVLFLSHGSSYRFPSRNVCGKAALQARVNLPRLGKSRAEAARRGTRGGGLLLPGGPFHIRCGKEKATSAHGKEKKPLVQSRAVFLNTYMHVS